MHIQKLLATAVCLVTPVLAQDECSMATAVVDGPNGPYTNVGATDSPEPWPCGGTASADVWYFYIATCTGTAQAQTCGGGFDTKIEVFSGTCGALVSLGCNDDSCGLQSSISWSTTMGTQYYIRVGGFSGATGNFPLDISCAGLLPNDECATAVAVVDGTNGPFTSLGASNSPEPWPCATGGSDVWFSYAATSTGEVTAATCGANYDSCIEAFSGTCGALTSLGCNDDFCTLQSSLTFPVLSGQTYYIRVGGFTGAQGNFPLEIKNEYPFDMLGIAETVPGTGTLGMASSAFVDGDTLRWNFDDPLSLAAGKFAAVVLNLSSGAPAPIGVTAGIPGFDQLWAGSTPAGLALVFPPVLVPATDQSVVVPPGLFLAADRLRMQGLVLDPANAPGFLPVVPTRNTIEFVSNAGTCSVSEGFEGVPVGLGNYPTGWGNGGGASEWRVDSGGTPSAGTGPNAAIEGVNYFYCETSGTFGPSDTWVMNTAVYPTAGLSAMAFQLSRVGDAIGVLEVRMGDGLGTFPTVLATYSGTGPAEWTQEVLGLVGAGANVQFQFLYTYGGGFRGDIAIDDFCLK